MSLQKVTTTLQAIPPGDPGILITAERISEMIREGSSDDKVKTVARTLDAAASLEHTPLLDRVFKYAKRYKYSEDHKEVARHYPRVRDPKKTEFLRSANFILTEGPRDTRLDCDDFTILIGSLLSALGYPIRLVIIAADDNRPGKFSHIYPEVFYNNNWTAMDALMKRPGDYHQKWSRRTFVKI